MNSAAAARSGMISGNFETVSNAALPMLPLPRGSWAGGLKDCYLYDEKTKTTAAKTPLVDPVISEYGGLLLAARFTLRFIEFVNQRYFLYQLVFDGQRLNYAAEVNRSLNNLSLMEVDPNEAKVRETVLFYLKNQTMLIHQSNVQKLKAYADNLAAIYAAKLAQVEYTLKNERKKLTANEAASFLKTSQDKIEEHLNQLFQKLNSQTAEQPLPKPDAVELPVGLKSVTADLLIKINSGFTPARAAELAPYINLAMASAQIQTLTAEAMFLAQVVHEIGLNPNLEEDGKNSTKTYGGKKYPYFFYMYDKESPDPNQRQTAKNIGNTEPGDGDRFHGRGFLQLTGRWNYNAAGNYIKQDLIARPEAVSNIETAALTAGWYWHQYRKINNLIKTGSEAEFSAVTEKINPPREGYNSRLVFWGKAKLVLGVQ